MVQICTSVSGDDAQELGGGGGCLGLAIRSGHDSHLRAMACRICEVFGGNMIAPQHGEVRINHLIFGWQVEPNLKQLQRIVCVAFHKREHLGVDNAPAGGEPLYIASPKSSRRPK